MTKLVLDKRELKEIKTGRAQVLKCANCGQETFYGQMPLLSLAMRNKLPVCSYDCNKALGQVD
jgi:hypothetical protein